MAKRYKQTLYQRKYVNGKQACEKIFNMIHHLRNAN